MHIFGLVYYLDIYIFPGIVYFISGVTQTETDANFLDVGYILFYICVVSLGYKS
jgi:hypothetical protein